MVLRKTTKKAFYLRSIIQECQNDGDAIKIYSDIQYHFNREANEQVSYLWTRYIVTFTDIVFIFQMVIYIRSFILMLR